MYLSPKLIESTKIFLMQYDEADSLNYHMIESYIILLKLIINDRKIKI